MFGRGVASWQLTSLGRTFCTTEYHIRFTAKDAKARLQFELIEGVPALSPCTGWPWPSEDGYKKITDSFAKSAASLDLALQGKGTKSRLKDF